MGTHFYQFAQSVDGSLKFWAKIKMEFYSESLFGVLIKDTDLENTKGSFIIDKKRCVKSGKTWLNNYLKK